MIDEGGPDDRALALEDVAWVHQTPRLRALDFDFAVRSADPGLGRHLDRLFTPFIVPGQPEHVYSIVPEAHTRDGTTRLYLDGDELYVAEQLPRVFNFLLADLNSQVIDRSSSYLLLHASAAEHAGRALLFPGPTESGKTTLVAALIRAGLRYITDEAVAIDPGTGLVHPFPKALSIDPGSWDALATLRPRVLEDGLDRFNTAQWHLPPDEIHSEALATPCRPALVVSPRYAAGGGTDLVALSGADAVILLIENAFNFATHGRVGLHLLADVARSCACFRLAVDNLDDACRLVLELADEFTDAGLCG